MSDTDGISQLIALYTTGLQATWLFLGADALLVYDFILTFDQEVNLFWHRKVTGATVLFLGTRYMAILTVITGLLSFATVSNHVFVPCTGLVRAQAAVEMCQYPFWAAFSALRALALSGMNWALGAVVFIMALAPFIVNVWSVINEHLSGANDPIFGCGAIEAVTLKSRIIGMSTLAIRHKLNWNLVLITWTTWAKGRGRSISGLVPTLSDVLMYNGTMYFLILSICNTIHLVLTLVSIVSPFENTSIVTGLTDPLTAILVWRYLLALQRANQGALVNGTQSAYDADEAPDGAGTGRDTLRFASVVIGSIGESLVGGDEDEESYPDSTLEYEDTSREADEKDEPKLEQEAALAEASTVPGLASGTNDIGDVYIV
ncbi:hypothetical protein C2E23DRAFT_886202 [Lenzites betulinus]|nr:hypothetical protein C2E23DRAFT_886202 [Lenzites betulinus]